MFTEQLHSVWVLLKEFSNQVLTVLLCVCYFSQHKEEMLKIYWTYVLVVVPGFEVFTAVWLRIPFSWDMKMCYWVSWFPVFWKNIVPTFLGVCKVQDPWRWRHYIPSKCSLITQRCSVTSHKKESSSCYLNYLEDCKALLCTVQRMVQ